MVKDHYYPSCGMGQIRARSWEPENAPVAVIQLVHGIAEHLERYDEFASYLCAQGYLVVAQDHMGHGKSTQAKGRFHGGWFAAVDDTYRLLCDTKTANPKIPYILFGHSMGSFLVRTILAKYPDSGINGAILCGTGWMPEAILTAGKAVANAICKLKGEQFPSKLLQKMMFGSYNNRIEHPRTAFDWLTRDKKIVDAYVCDPACGFIPSAGMVRDMLSGMLYNQNSKILANMNPETPVLFIAGGDDPVGNYGAGVEQTSAAFRNVGVNKVTTKLYPLCRHEILNEINKTEIYKDIASWILST